MTLTDADLARLEGHTQWDVKELQGFCYVVTRSDGYGVAGPFTHEDALLIAAAPDLVAELREARAALARVKALCESAVAEYEPHDVTPWVAVHELRAALADE